MTVARDRGERLLLITRVETNLMSSLDITYAYVYGELEYLGFVFTITIVGDLSSTEYIFVHEDRRKHT